MIKMRSFPPPKSIKRKREISSSLSTSNLDCIEFPTKIRKKIDNKLRRDELNYLSYSLDLGNFKFYLKKESDNLYSITRNKFLAFCGDLDYYGKNKRDILKKILHLLNENNYKLKRCDRYGNLYFEHTIDSFKKYIKNIFYNYMNFHGSFVIPVEYIFYFNINIRLLEEINDKNFFFDRRFNVILFFPDKN